MAPRVAVIGAGISGLTCAYLLRNTHEVTLFEADDRLGGHSHTHHVTLPSGEAVNVDSGFIVHNHRTYPHLLKLFAELDVATQPTEMSMSIRCEGCGLQYAGGRGARGILAQPVNALKPRFVRMLLSVKRFHREAKAHLNSASDGDEVTFGEWLNQHGFSDYFVAHFAIPLVACVWSSGHETALEYPARYLFKFLDHHGMLTVKDSPQWYTVVDGSARYVEKIAASLPDVRLGAPAVKVARDGSQGVSVVTEAGREAFDHVVITTHGNAALAMLDEPTSLEQEVLGAFSYTQNRTELHTDESWLPAASEARASWNYRMKSCNAREASPSVTYWMNRLHNLDVDMPLLVTLDEQADIAPDKVLASMRYEHPRYTRESVAASQRIDEICDERISYAGAHLGWGFHEDGCRSGVLAAERLGVKW